MIGGAVIGAAGTAVAGHQASQATKGATNAAIAQQDKALQQQAELSAPYRQLGQSAIPGLQSLLGLTGPGAGGSGGYRPTPGGGVQPIMGGAGAPDPTAALRATPGYQFARDQGLQGVTNAATAQGMNLSGNTLEALDKYGTGLADQTYQQAVGNFENVVNTGQAAAAGQAANVGNAAANNSNALINQGNTLAGIGANETAGIVRSIGNASDQYGQYQTLQGLNNPGGAAGTAVSGAYPGDAAVTQAGSDYLNMGGPF